MRLRAVCFDAAGTLFDVREPVGLTYARLAATLRIVADPARLTEAFRRALQAAAPLAFPGVPATHLPALERRWWRAIVDATFAAAGVPAVPEALFSALFEHYADPAAWNRYDEAPRVLAALRRRGYGLAIVSNFDSRLDRLVDGLGIGPLVDAVVCSTRAGAAKPDPRIFAYTLAALGAAPQETLHVGNDPAADVAGARAAGLHAVLLDRRPEREAAVATAAPVIFSLDDLGSLLESWR